MARGTVKWFDKPQKGYGFIQPQGAGGKDGVRAHLRSRASGLKVL